MNNNHIRTMIRVGEITTQPNKKKLVFIPDSKFPKEQLRDKRGRIYRFDIDGKVEKIGGSIDAGGIRSTIGWYLNGYAQGNNESRYCIWNYLTQVINAGKKVEIYAVWAPMVDAEVPTMTGYTKVKIPVDYHLIEKSFIDEYVKSEGTYPKLNMQESGQRWKDTGLLEGLINKDGSIYGSQVIKKGPSGPFC